MVSTRLQSNSNSNCGDGAMLSASEIIASKLQCGIGCVTRSSASGNAQPIGHSKDINLRSTINLMDLPVELIQNILSHCGYKTVANLRVVNKKMDVICGSLLNLTFNKLQNSMLTRFHSIKAQMPRRESARRQHPLACEFDIVETIYMRLNLLHMTFGKHIEKKLMYFFPGEGVVIPLVVVQPLNVDDEEATSKMEVEEPEPKDGQNLCSIAEDVASSSNDVSTVQEDDIDPLNPETSCSSNAFKMRAPRIPRHKQVLEKGSYKKSRGVLKLRNKTIRIMK